MTAEDRRRIKQAIDARRRELVVDEGRKYYNREDCVACGGPLHKYTPGCTRCRDRELKLLRRRGVRTGRLCGECGIGIAEYTCGCSACKRRRNKRASRARKKAVA